MYPLYMADLTEFFFAKFVSKKRVRIGGPSVLLTRPSISDRR